MVQMSTGGNAGLQLLLQSMTQDLNLSYDQIQSELKDYLQNREKYLAWKQKEEMESRRVQLLQQQIDRSVEVVRADRESSQGGGGGNQRARRSSWNGQQPKQPNGIPKQAPAYPLISTRKQAQRFGENHGVQQQQKLSVSTLKKLQREYEKETDMLNDDVQFIGEVCSGEEVAEDMNPLLELVNLKKQFDSWKEEYKMKLRKAREIIHVTHTNTKGQQQQIEGRNFVRSMTPQSIPSGSQKSRENKRKLGGLFRSRS